MMKIYQHDVANQTTELVDLDPQIAAEWQVEAEQSAWANLRAKRNGLLAGSDWAVLADTPTNTATWKAYRQALRDLPANTADPANPIWPTPPA